ncbi:CDP-alcohol phosphatidyltransferase family protein [Clostridium paraputrificum]|uniref:CDP-alcohol phosphatidyltransferase family protein n=1 Tax=Clostridium TaxID=1485 RepID=UPI003D351F18
MKTIPNYISVSRIILSLTLIFIKPFSLAFYVIYIICGLSDIIDGFIARKTGTTSIFGAKLDSVADMVMVGVIILLFYPIINPAIEIIIWILLIAIIRLSSMVLALKKYKTFASIHTYGNKITGIVLFLFPILYYYIHTNGLMYIVCVMGTLSAIEEFIINFTSSQLQLDRQSILKNEYNRKL